MTTAPANIVANTDVLILKNIDDNISILNKMRPGQVVISTSIWPELIELCKQRGVRKLITIDEIEYMQIFPGLLFGDEISTN
jgi:3-deoxy-D-manno-octulosonic-acid transferase